jgi:methylenetetrahydrofolate dehydrogenase (NADP+) / methenyltetrahydrofolate cyclohydrolase
MQLLDGKSLSATICQNIKDQLSSYPLTQRPALAFILIGNNSASQTYVRMKKKRCEEVGIQSETIALPETISEKTLIDTIDSLNHNPSIDAILVQQPLPKHVNTERIFEAVDPKKDVDGLHPLNLGKLLIGEPTGFFPCTPLGILKLLEAYKIDPKGRHVVIIGRSNIVGKPLAAMLAQKKPYCNATVTLAHHFTQNLTEVCLLADILIAATGHPHLIDQTMVKPGAVVIDVGITRLADSTQKIKIVGDIHFDQVAPIASAITPVPGGVGPMTIAMLLSNTVKSFQNRRPHLKIVK